MFDCIIVGAGPCGVSSAIYLKRAGFNVAIIEKAMVGGQIGYSSELCNYAGYVEKDTFQFCMNLQKQLTELEVPVIMGEVVEIKKEDKVFYIQTRDGVQHLSLSCILSIGAESKKLGIDSEAKFVGRGVCYCAVCDGNFYRNKAVAVIGGGNSGFEDAIYLSKICSKVYLIHRRDVFSAEKYLQNTLKKLTVENGGNVEIITNATAQEFLGQETLEKVVLNVGGEEKILSLSGIFIAVGREPKSAFLQNFVELDRGYIKAYNGFHTSKEGVFVGGDCMVKNLRQVVTAVSDGAHVASEVANFLQA